MVNNKINFLKKLIRANICGDGYDAYTRADLISDYVENNFMPKDKNDILLAEWHNYKDDEGEYLICSECGMDEVLYYDKSEYRFCRWCGAKMQCECE